MSKHTWKDIESELKRTDAKPAMREPEAFWREFKARADRAEIQITESRDPILFAGWLKAVAGIAVLAGVVFMHLRDANESLTQSQEIVLNSDTRSATSEGGESKIKSLEIFTCYEATLILKDEESGSSILWIANLDVGSVAGEDCL